MSDEQTGPVGPDDASADATHGGGAHTEGTGATGARSGDAGHPPTAGADPGSASTGDAGTDTPSAASGSTAPVPPRSR